MNNSRLDNLKKLYEEAKLLSLYYQYAIWYNNRIDELKKEEKMTKENKYVKKLVLTKKFRGKDLVVG